MVTLEPGRAAFLVGRWKTAVEDDVALGHLPQHTHPERNVSRLMSTSRCFKDVYASCSALAVAARTKRTEKESNVKIVGTPKSKHGAAIAVLVDQGDTLDVLHLVVNPDSANEKVITLSVMEMLAAIKDHFATKDLRLAASARLGLDFVSDSDLGLVASDAILPDQEFKMGADGLFPDQREARTPVASLAQEIWLDLS